MKLQRTILFSAIFILVAGFYYLRTPYYHAPVVGDVEPFTEAFELGFRGGDRILNLNDKEIVSWEDFSEALKEYQGERVSLRITRKTNTVVLPLGVPSSGRIIGLDRRSKLAVLTLNEKSILKNYGITAGDRIVRIGRSEVSYWRDLAESLAQQDASLPLELRVEKASGETASVSLPSSGKAYTLKELGIENPLYFVIDVKRRSLAAQLGLKKYDRILTIQSIPVMAQIQLAQVQESMVKAGKLEVGVWRGDKFVVLKTSVSSTDVKVEGGLSELRHFLGLDYSSIEHSGAVLDKKDFKYYFSAR